jgi:hypothetical protein
VLTCPRPADSPVAALAELADIRYLEELPEAPITGNPWPQPAGRCQARRHRLVTDTPNTSSAACNASGSGSGCGPGSGSGSVPAAALAAAAAGVPAALAVVRVAVPAAALAAAVMALAAALAVVRVAVPAVRAAGPAPASRVLAALLDQHLGRGLAPSCRALRRWAPRAHGNDLRAPGDDSQPGPPPHHAAADLYRRPVRLPGHALTSRTQASYPRVH